VDLGLSCGSSAIVKLSFGFGLGSVIREQKGTIWWILDIG